MVVVAVDRESLARDLWEYGEDGLAERALGLSDFALGRIGMMAGRLWVAGDNPDGSGPMLVKACALAAVEVMEGMARPLRRQRRRIHPDNQVEAEQWDPHEARTVSLDVCESVARRFAVEGFRFAASGPHMSRVCGQFRFQVTFYLRGGNLSLSAQVASRDLRAWLRTHGNDDGGYLAADRLDNLVPQVRSMSWDLFGRFDVPRVLEMIEREIRTVALPWFSVFEEEERLADALAQTGVAGCNGLKAVEWLLATDRREAAQLHGATMLRDQHLQRAYLKERERLARDGTEGGRYSGIGEGLAYATAMYGLAFSVRDGSRVPESDG